jgi:sulfofructose kinase
VNPQVLCIGVITVDTIALVDKYPSADDRVIAEEIVRAGGGPAAVASVALARLGVSSAIAGTIGNDADGDYVLDIFKREGVNTEGITRTSTPTGGAVIVASREYSARAISTRQPIHQAPLNDRAKAIASKADWVHVDHVGVHQLKGAGIVRGSGPKISFDAGYDVENFDVTTVDLFAPNDKSLLSRHPGKSFEEALTIDAEKGASLVVATQGSVGSAGYSAQTGLVKAPSFKTEIVSTLGAGDVFHGALLAQLIQGFALQEAIRRANAVAALSCRGLDGQSAIPTTSELNTYLSGVK